ncbi:hypothetical protein SAMN04488543_4069 [Friedmanniella luteola]|uniref:Uncharacterized protein n=2 Tax=Friedmanniella luteola TaxID=546871 RepID=A0A1H1ZXC0_9ACTN|nr:hypothetical protein SAMN04488543_4069 [Friedmanniella luteola]
MITSISKGSISKRHRTTTEGNHHMSRLGKAIRSHREINRTNRELARAISNAATPAMRDELIMVAQRNNGFGPRT